MVEILASQKYQKDQKNIIIKDFTIQFVLKKVLADKLICEEKQQSIIDNLESFEAKDITNGKAFMSVIIRLSFKWKVRNFFEDIPSSIIMKVPFPQHETLKGENTKEDDMKPNEVFDFLVIAHTREIRFYENFPLFEPRAKLPKFYYGSDYHPSHHEGLIIMEDLSKRGDTIPVLPGFNEPQLFALLEEVAMVHATSWRFPQWEKLIGTVPITPGFFAEMQKSTHKLVELDPAVFKPLMSLLSPSFTFSSCGQSNYSGSKFGFPACLVHADLWTPNVLWIKDSQGQPTNKLCAIIDWQMVHSGNPGEDICRILSLNTTGIYRRKNTERLLTYYAGKVAEFMGGSSPFTILQLKEAYRQSMAFSAMYLCFGVVYYHEMDSIVGTDQDKRKLNQRELLERCRMFLEDTVESFDKTA